MAGVKALRILQLGKETTKGTNVDATVIWRGLGVIKDQQEVVFPEENVGYLGGVSRSYISRYWAELAMPDVEATFEQLPYLFEAGVATEVPTVDGTGSTGYIYKYVAPTTEQETVTTYSFEGGDDNQAEEFDYGFVKKLVLSGDGQGAMFMSADWVGQTVSNTTFKTGLSPVAVEEILMNSGVLYIDSTGGTIGETTVSDTLFGINLSWTTGLQEYWALDGSKDFSLVKQTGDEIILAMTFEHNAAAVLQKAEYRENITRLVRLKFEGTALETSSDYANKALIIDLAGVYEDWSVLDERDGNDVVEATMRVRYSVADALKAEVIIVNAASSLP